MITLEINGIKYQGWTSIDVFRSIECICGNFNFSATTSNTNNFPISAGSSCRVWIDSTMVVNGYIDSVEVSYDSSSHVLTIEGRDKTCDLVDGTIVNVKEFQGMNLIQIITKVLSDNNMSDIKIINQSGDLTEPFSDNDPAATPIGQTFFNFIESYARKRQVLLTTDGMGNIVLARGASELSSTILENIVDGKNNNIKSGSIKYNLSKRFYKYTIQSSLNPSAISSSSGQDPIPQNEDESGDDYDYGEGDNSVNNESIATQSGFAFDTSIRNTRSAEVIAKTCDSSVNLMQLAIWTKNLAIARGIEYEVVVQGYYQDAASTKIWKHNILVQVNDNFANINGVTMLVKSVNFKLSLDGGSVTHICLVAPDVYTLELEVESEVNLRRKKGIGIGSVLGVPAS